MQSLVSAALGQEEPAPEPLAEPTESQAEALGDAEALIGIYFDLESPQERDAVFDQLTAHRGDMVDHFFSEMASHDNDPYVRAAASAELYRRGHAEYLAALESDIMDPQALFFFANALHTLAEVKGEDFYPDLVQMLADPNRDPEHQPDIMLAMESVAPEQALRHFAALMSGWTQIDAIDEFFLEHASLAFARESYEPGYQCLQKIQTMIENSHGNADDKEELLELVSEALSITSPEQNS